MGFFLHACSSQKAMYHSWWLLLSYTLYHVHQQVSFDSATTVYLNSTLCFHVCYYYYWPSLRYPCLFPGLLWRTPTGFPASILQFIIHVATSHLLTFKASHHVTSLFKICEWFLLLLKSKLVCLTYVPAWSSPCEISVLISYHSSVSNMQPTGLLSSLGPLH